MLHMFHTHIACVLSGCCIFNEKFECSMQYETDVATWNEWLIIFFNIFFDIGNGDFLYCICLFSILQTLFFSVRMVHCSVWWEVFPLNVRALAVPFSYGKFGSVPLKDLKVRYISLLSHWHVGFTGVIDMWVMMVYI